MRILTPFILMLSIVLTSSIYPSKVIAQELLRENNQAETRSMLTGQAIMLVSFGLPAMCKNFYAIPSVLVFYAAALTNLIGTISLNQQQKKNSENILSSLEENEVSTLNIYQQQVNLLESRKSGAKKKEIYQGIVTGAAITATAIAVVEAIAESGGAGNYMCKRSSGGWMEKVAPFAPMIFAIGGLAAKEISYHDDFLIDFLQEQKYATSGQYQSLSLDEYESIKQTLGEQLPMISKLLYQAVYVGETLIHHMFPVAYAQAVEPLPTLPIPKSVESSSAKNSMVEAVEKQQNRANEALAEMTNAAVQTSGSLFNKLMTSSWTRVGLFGAIASLSTMSSASMKKQISTMEHNISVLKNRAKQFGSMSATTFVPDESSVCLSAQGQLDQECECRKKNNCHQMKTTPFKNIPKNLQSQIDDMILRAQNVAQGQPVSPMENIDRMVNQFEKNKDAINKKLSASMNKMAQHPSLNSSAGGGFDLDSEVNAVLKDLDEVIPDKMVDEYMSSSSYQIKHGHLDIPSKNTDQEESFDLALLMGQKEEEKEQTGIILKQQEAEYEYEYDSVQESSLSLFEMLSLRYQKTKERVR